MSCMYCTFVFCVSVHVLVCLCVYISVLCQCVLGYVECISVLCKSVLVYVQCSLVFCVCVCVCTVH